MAQPYPQACDRGVIASRPCPRELGREPDARTKAWTLAACVLASSLALIDGSALTVALPALADHFNVSLGGLHWVLNGYVLALASMTMAGGALADARGRRRMLIVGCAAFAITSAACALAPSLGALVIARVLQGVAAALVTPASLALIGEVFPRDERNRAIGIWAAASALTTAGGPVLGGWLTDSLGWPAVFWINPPLALLAIVVLVRFGKPGPRQGGAFDWPGAALLAATMALAAYAITNVAPSEVAHDATEGGTGTLLAAVAALGCGVAFVSWQRRARTPMMPPGLFARRNFSALNIATVLVYAGLSIMFFLVPFELIETRGLEAAQAGLVFLPFTLALGLLSQLSGKLADQLGARPMLVLGPVVAGASYIAMATLQDASLVAAMIVPMLTAGIGFAMLVAPLTAGVMAAVDEQDVGLASGLNNTAGRVAQLLGVALAAGIAPLAGGYALALGIAAALSIVGGLVPAVLRAT